MLPLPSGSSGPPASVLNRPGYNINADQGDKILGTMITLIVLASTFVSLRLISRYLARAGFWVSKMVIRTQKRAILMD